MYKTRDRWNSKYNFDISLDDNLDFYQESKEELKSCDPDDVSWEITSVVSAISGIIEDLYIRGDSLDSLGKYVDELLELSKKYLFATASEQERSFSTGDDFYMLLAFMRGLGMNDFQMSEFSKNVRVVEDDTIDRLLSVYSPSRQALPKNEKSYPRCDRLHKILDSPIEEMPALLKDYLDKWDKHKYKFNYHILAPEILNDGSQPPWNGFWCYFVAAIVATLNLDDSEFIDHEYYPTDLMLEFRKHKGEPRATAVKQ